MSLSLAEWLERLERQHPVAIDLGLERCGAVWERLGAPRPARRIITVAGTNGKGSAVAWLESLYREAGFKTACYTSPHILEFNERLRIDGVNVSDEILVQAFETVESAREGESLTYFEFTTLACLLIMSNAALDCALLEVGLGGRLDTVNLIDADLAMIMPIGLDHQQFLGPDRESIGAEKAGIIRSGRPVVVAEKRPPESVLNIASDLGANLLLAGRDFNWHEIDGELEIELEGMGLHLDLPVGLPLAGEHQSGNLASALAAVNALDPDVLSDPYRVAGGIGRAQLPGRLMGIPADPRLVLDVGHNPMAASVVAEYLKQEGHRVTCLLAMLADKDAEGVASALSAVVEHWYCAGLSGERGQTGDALADRVRSVITDGDVLAFPDVGHAISEALRASSPEQSVLVFGSFETVAAALRAL